MPGGFASTEVLVPFEGQVWPATPTAKIAIEMPLNLIFRYLGTGLCQKFHSKTMAMEQNLQQQTAKFSKIYDNAYPCSIDPRVPQISAE